MNLRPFLFFTVILAGLLLTIPLIAIEQAQKTLSVNASASYLVKPDKATVVVQVESFAVELEDAKDDLYDAIDRIKSNLKDAKIKHQSILDYMLIKPTIKKKYPDTVQQILGYKCYNRLTIHINNPKLIEKVISAAVEGGATEILNVFLGVSRKKANIFRAKTRKLAVQAARLKAEKLAEQYELTVAGIVSIRENQVYWNRNPFSSYKLYIQKYSQAYRPTQYSTIRFDVQVRENSEGLSEKLISVHTSIYVVYELKTIEKKEDKNNEKKNNKKAKK